MEVPVETPDRSDAIGRHGKARRGFRVRFTAALQGQQAGDHLEVVQQPVTALLIQNLLMAYQLVLLSKQNLILREKRAQLALRDFGRREFAFEARNGVR